MSEHLTKMIEALGIEISAIRSKGGAIKIQLRAGESLGQADGNFLYRFAVAEDIYLRDETPIRLAAGQEEVPGILVSLRDGILVVAMEKDLGPQVVAARLIADDSFLLERLKERLEKVQSGEAQFDKSSADRVLGFLPSSTSHAEPHHAVFGDAKANTDQMNAVRQALGSNVTYVWGPPGTGKTTTIARIVEAYYRAGKSILLVSNTNIAVDTALEKVAERLKGEPDFHQGFVVRQGPVVKEELRRSFGPQVILAEIVDRIGDRLKREKEKLLLEAAPLEGEERSLAIALKTLQRLEYARQILGVRQRALDTTKSNIASREREAEQHRSRATNIRVNIDRARQTNALKRLFSRLNIEQLERNAIASDLAAQAATDAAKALTIDLHKLQGEIASLHGEIDRLIIESKNYPMIAQINSRLDALLARLGQIRERIAAIDAELAELEQQVLARCKILATTVYRTYLGQNAPRKFDAVVIDEASMLMPPLVYYVAGLGTQSVTVAGDFRQLPPIVMSEEQIAEDWLKRDVFSIAGIPDRLTRRQQTPQLVALRTQYRMREQICNIVNKFFYSDHPLRSAPSVNCVSESFPFSESPLLFVNTASFHPWTSIRIGTYSRYNLFHALLVRNIVLHFAEKGCISNAGEPNNAIGAVSPYSAQARLIQALLDDRLGVCAAGIAATVHRFQGNEKTAMILDLTDSTGVRLGRFLKATDENEEGARLLNVAISRARQNIVLIANFEYLLEKTPRDGIVQRLVNYFAENGKALDTYALLPLCERDWFDGLHKVLPPTFEFPEGAAGVFAENTFYPAFIKDLTRAIESVVIFSPFATERGTARWFDALRTALERGIRARIITRPPDEFGGGSCEEVTKLIREFRRLGIIVDQRARMHEKIAIIDGRILWFGSLNILSHRDTHEIMQRIESPAACHQISRIVSTLASGKEEEKSHTLDSPENPDCPICGCHTVWNNGRFGVYFNCEEPNCDGKVDPRRGTGRKRSVERKQLHAEKKQGVTNNNGHMCPEPGCNGRLKERSGRFGRFLGCTNYPRCRYTRNFD